MRLGDTPLASIPLGAFPGEIVVGPSRLVLSRASNGKVFTLAVPLQYHFGEFPVLNENCVLLLYLGPGFQSTEIPALVFTRPDGAAQNADPRFLYVGPITVAEKGVMGVPDFPAGQYLIYPFAIGELSQLGTWLVQATVGYYQSRVYPFQVITPPSYPPPRFTVPVEPHTVTFRP